MPPGSGLSSRPRPHWLPRPPGPGGASPPPAPPGPAPRAAPAAAVTDAAAAPARLDLATVVAKAADAGNPVPPLVRALRDAVGADAAGAVHVGATSQDVLDTALVLLARNAIAVIDADLAAAAGTAAELAAAHRD